VLVLLLTLAPPQWALAGETAGTGVVTALAGQATLARATLPQPVALSFRDNVFVRDRIATGERSLVHVLMGGKALLTVRELSELTITEDTDHALIDLQAGKIGLAVLRERMRPGESIELRTPNAIAAVRGTVLVMEIVPGSAGSVGSLADLTTNVHLLHGALDVSLRHDPSRLVTLHTFESVGVSGNIFGAVHSLSAEAAAAVTVDLNAKQPAHTSAPSEFTQRLLEREREHAALHATTLLHHAHRSTVVAKTWATSQAPGATTGAKVAEKAAGAAGDTAKDANTQLTGIAQGAATTAGARTGGAPGTEPVQSAGLEPKGNTGSGLGGATAHPAAGLPALGGPGAGGGIASLVPLVPHLRPHH
jgi:hypothetical protein